MVRFGLRRSQCSFGSAHVVPALEARSHALLHDIGVGAQTKGLERIVAAARRLAEISTKLEPGTLETVNGDRW